MGSSRINGQLYFGGWPLFVADLKCPFEWLPSGGGPEKNGYLSRPSIFGLCPNLEPSWPFFSIGLSNRGERQIEQRLFKFCPDLYFLLAWIFGVVQISGWTATQANSRRDWDFQGK